MLTLILALPRGPSHPVSLLVDSMARSTSSSQTQSLLQSEESISTLKRHATSQVQTLTQGISLTLVIVMAKVTTVNFSIL